MPPFGQYVDAGQSGNLEKKMSEEEISLSEVFASEADEVIVNDPVEVDQAEIITEEVETVNENTAVTAETENVVNETNVSDEVRGLRQAASSERKKKQALEREIAEMRQAAQNPVELPDAYIEPQDAINHAIGQANKANETRFLNLSESQARGRHADFDVMSDVFFNDLAANNPNLSQQAMSAPDPFEFVYQQGKKHNEIGSIGSIDDYRAKIEKEIYAKIEAEKNSQAKIDANNAINNALPNSLAQTTAIGDNQVPIEQSVGLGDVLLNNF